MANVNLLLSKGHSFSGREPNCAFLNMRNGQFATVSSVAGIDFPDDARAVGTTDWDHDGDIDIWLSNRTAPRLRLLLNQTGTSHHYIALRLVGSESNRDGIGARVAVTPRDGDPPLIATCRAGDGFLSQSSKWLHFGLGQSAQVDRIDVTWPSGSRERILDVAVGGRYEIREGEGRARRVDVNMRAIPDSVVDAGPATEGGTRITLSDPIPMPPLPYQDPAGQDRVADLSAMTLINLWASWCAPCIRELGEIADSEERIRRAGIQVLALCVDRQAEAPGTDPAEAERILDQMDFPFLRGIAVAETVVRLHALLETPFNVYLDLATPTSILVDDNKRLLAIYRGPVSVEQVIRDAGTLPSSSSSFAALPLPGKWFNEPPPTDVLRIARELMDRRHLDDAVPYVRENEARLSTNKEFSRLAVWIGDELVRRGDDLDGLQFYEMALRHEADDFVVMNNVAWQLATNPDARIRDGERAVLWARRAAELTASGDPNVLGTLAASYAEDGRFDKALEIGSEAVRLARNEGDETLLASLQQQMVLFRSGRPYRSD